MTLRILVDVVPSFEAEAADQERKDRRSDATMAAVAALVQQAVQIFQESRQAPPVQGGGLFDDEPADAPPGARQSAIFDRQTTTFYDTLLSLENASDELKNETFLFNQHAGQPLLSNMYLNGCLPQEQTLTVHGMRAKIWFEASPDKLWNELYPLIETGLTFELHVGQRRECELQMDPTFVADTLEDGIPAEDHVLNLGFDIKAIHIPSRQNFGVKVTASPSLVAAVNALPGRKFIRVYLDGERTRPLQ